MLLDKGMVIHGELGLGVWDIQRGAGCEDGQQNKMVIQVQVNARDNG